MRGKKSDPRGVAFRLLTALPSAQMAIGKSTGVSGDLNGMAFVLGARDHVLNEVGRIHGILVRVVVGKVVGERLNGFPRLQDCLSTLGMFSSYHPSALGQS